MTTPQPLHPAVREAVSTADWTTGARLVTEYAASVSTPGCFEGLSAEISNIDRVYAPPHGGLWIAWVGDEAAGCCAFRPCPDADHVNACEMKRLYVLHTFRGLGVGRALVEAVLQAARLSGYSCVLLDTLHEMEAARSLYEDMGFVEIPPYVQTPLPGAHHLKVIL
ncbi:MAG: GNAT family N-acetyltransferase [Burkholderiaceae bacterium]|nr:GNAT family N-acetyltransferase [Burkholderiaceae bacterium]